MVNLILMLIQHYKVTAPTVDIDASTEVNISNALTVGGTLTIGGTALTSTAAELNILDGVTAQQLN